MIGYIHLLKNKTSWESLLKVFYFNNRGTRKVKNLQKLSNKDIYFTLQNDNEDYIIIDLLNLFHGKTTLNETMFWTLKSGANFLLTGSKHVRIVIFFPSSINLFISPYL